MSSTADQLAALSNDSHFRSRVMALAIQIAGNEIYVESSGTANHEIRIDYAKNVMNGGGVNIPNVLVNRPNLIAGTTTYDFATGHIKTDVSDAAIISQLASDWNMLAGV